MPAPARDRASTRVAYGLTGRLGLVLGLALLVLLALIPISGALAASSSSRHRHPKAGHRRVRHSARCARRTRHSRHRSVRHRTKRHSRAHRSRYPSCGSGARHRRHHTKVRKHHAAEHRSAPRPPVSHATASAGPNGTVTIAAPGAACEGTSLRPSEANLEVIRTATLCLVNRERSAHGEGLLGSNTDLQHAAQGHSESMASASYFEHAGPGGSFVERIMDSGYLPGPNALYNVGENIAYGSLQDATAGSIVAAWMASPGHRANILNSAFREVGTGIVPRLPASLGGGEAGAIYTEDFGVVM